MNGVESLLLTGAQQQHHYYSNNTAHSGNGGATTNKETGSYGYHSGAPSEVAGLDRAQFEADKQAVYR